jgi:glycosyltransferase involved in cell wall biosynthesis
MKENRFVFVIPFRNAKDFIAECASSLIEQNYKNWIAIFCDDNSTDNTVDYIPKDSRFIIIKNKERLTALSNIHYAIVKFNLNDEDIICLLDGDDYLIKETSVDIINSLYQDETLLTYGQYVWKNGHLGHCGPYTQELFTRLRTYDFLASHIKTFKYKLYKELINQDPKLSCYKDNNDNFYTVTYDVAIMIPLMEIAGFDKVKFNPNPVYYYRVHDANDYLINLDLQKSVEKEILAKPKFKQTF